jgi:cytochrome c6
VRHEMTTRFALVVTAVLLLAALAWVGLAGTLNDAEPTARSDRILALEPRTEEGRDLFTDTPGRACASCHSLAAAGVETDDGPSLDDLEATAATTVASLVEGTVPVHDDEDYGNLLSNQQIADLAAYLEEATGAG